MTEGRGVTAVLALKLTIADILLSVKYSCWNDGKQNRIHTESVEVSLAALIVIKTDMKFPIFKSTDGRTNINCS